MNKNKLIKKGVVLGINVLFVGMSISSSVMSEKVMVKETPSVLNTGAIITVDDEGDGDYISIQDAIDNADPGDAIEVYSGTYDRITVDKQLILKGIAMELGGGDDTGMPIIHGSGSHAVLVSADCVNITGFTIQNGWYGMLLSYSSNDTITGNTITDDSWIGILMSHSSANVLTNNIFESNGIYLRGDSVLQWNTHTIENNTANGRPIRYYKNMNDVIVPGDPGQVILANCINFTIQNLDLSDVDGCIQLGFSSYTNIIENNITNNTPGIELTCSSNNTITGNTMTNNDNGIRLWYSSSNNNIYENNFTNNNYGIYIGENSSSNNYIYHNNFINNAQNAIDDCGNNLWYDTSSCEGNYWDDYNGIDTDGDGIGEEPYQKDAVDDPYPLVMTYPMNGVKANFVSTQLYSSDLSTIVFTDRSSAPYTTIVNWTWNMGDDNILNGENVTYSYAEMGIYDVTLNITDNIGNTDECTKQVIAMSPETPYPDLLVFVSPQYKDDLDIIATIDTYKTAVYNDLGWNCTTHLMRDQDNTPDDIVDIVKAYYSIPGDNLKAVVLAGEDLKLPLLSEFSYGEENPRLFDIATLNMPPTYQVKVLPSMVFPNNATDPYAVKKDQLIYAFTKFSNRTYNYGQGIRGYNFPSDVYPSESYMEELLAPLGDAIWIENATPSERDLLFEGCYRMVLLTGHGDCRSVCFGYGASVATDSAGADMHGIVTPVLFLENCYAQGWGDGEVNNELDPPDPFMGHEFFGHTILTDDHFRLIMAGTGGIMWMLGPDIVERLASGKTFAEAVVGCDGFLPGRCVFYGDPTFHYPSVINLNSNKYFWKIQDAIDAPETLDGHTISVGSGIFYENVVIHKNISLVGQGREMTVIDGMGSAESAVHIENTDFVSLTGFTIRNGTYGVSVDASSNTLIMADSIFNNTLAAIYLKSSDSVRVTNNGIHDNSWGIHMTDSSNDAVISCNNIYYNEDSGIQLENSSNNLITINDIISNNMGLTIDAGGNENLIYHNNFIDNIQSAFDAGSNIWYHDMLQEGNYWSDFDEPSEGAWDNDGDGRVDSSYNIAGKTPPNQDRYPLINLYQPSDIFLRGDYNADGIVDTIDMSDLLEWLSGGEDAPSCWDAADVNDNGVVELEDATYLEIFLQGSGPPPLPPYPDCGLDPTPDDSLDCEEHNYCDSIWVGVHPHQVDPRLPKAFALSQNYPNPFNAITHIKYALLKDCQVKLEIYNILGQKVVTLVDGEQKAGYKTIRWDAGSLSSGIYFYRLHAGDFFQTRKVVLLK